MAIQSGPITLCRYRVLGLTKGLGLKTLNERLEPYISREVDLKGKAGDIVLGWVRPLGLDQLDLPPAAHWDLSDAQLTDGFMLRMRIEKRKVPGSLLQLVLRQEVASEAGKRDKPLSRKEKSEIKEKVMKDLMGRALPAISYVDAFWKSATGELMLFSSSKTIRTQFESLFHDTFGKPFDLSLLPVEPPSLGLTPDRMRDNGVAEDILGRLSLAVPVAFAEQAYP